MTSVYLYGDLKNKFGEEFNFKINSPKEAFAAINANRKGFLDEVKRQASKGTLYRIIIDDKIVEHNSDILVNRSPKEIHIVPVVWGAGKNAGGIAMLAIGIGLIAFTAGASLGYFGAVAEGLLGGGGILGSSALGSAVISIGAGLAIQGAMSLLFPQPKPDFNQEVQAGGKSYLFGNRQNNMAQGQAVPVGYGRLLIGSSQISSSATHYSLKTDMRALMTPTDQPIDDYMELDFADEPQTPGVIKYDSFYTNQSSSFDDTPSFSSINILNSYINILTKSAETVTSSIVEAVVKTDGVVVSNPDLTSFNQDVSFTWTDLTADTNKGKIKIENPYAFDEGLVYRVYRNNDFKLYSEYNVTNATPSTYFATYDIYQVVRYGPSQFEKLNFQKWDENISYISGELIWYDTGDGNQTRYRAKTAGSGHNPTGAGYSTYWEQLTAPINEEIYKSNSDTTRGYLPTDTSQWTKITTPSDKSSMDTLTDLFGTPVNEDVYIGDMELVSQSTIDGSNAIVENCMTEFLGYIYIDKVADREIDAVDAVNGVMYEITKVGNTNWSSIGVVGSPALGTTFTKNSTTATGNGKVYPVVKYKFTLDCDDAADLQIDGQLATYKYNDGGMSFPTTNTAIQNLAATANSTVVMLTTGYHKIYARLYNHLYSSGLSLYYQYDSNWDTVFSDWKIIPQNALYHQKLNDLAIAKNVKFKSKISDATLLNTTLFVTGQKYKIITLGTVNWSSIGASSPQVGSVFVKNSTTATGAGGKAFSDTYSYAEAKSASSNRLMRFFAQRPIDIANVDTEGVIYRANYQCTAQVGRLTLYSSPVKIYIKFLPTSTNLNGAASRTILPIEAQQTA